MSAIHWRLEHERWLVRKLEEYADTRQDLVLWSEAEPALEIVTNQGRAVVRPPLALFACQPSQIGHRPSPLVVVEFATEGNFTWTWRGDVDLYLRSAGATEHWVVDLREGPKWLVLSTRRLHQGQERLNEFCRGDDFKTPTLPGFELLIDPRR